MNISILIFSSYYSRIDYNNVNDMKKYLVVTISIPIMNHASQHHRYGGYILELDWDIWYLIVSFFVLESDFISMTGSLKQNQAGVLQFYCHTKKRLTELSDQTFFGKCPSYFISFSENSRHCPSVLPQTVPNRQMRCSCIDICSRILLNKLSM